MPTTTRRTRSRLAGATFVVLLASLLLASTASAPIVSGLQARSMAVDAGPALPLVLTPLEDMGDALYGIRGITPLLVFFCFVWILWLCKYLLAAWCFPARDPEGATAHLRTTVIAPVFDEPEDVFRTVLRSVRDNQPAELIVVVDGGDPRLVELSRRFADRVLAIPKSGKREAIARGFAESDPRSDVIVVLDSDTVWEPGLLRRLLRPFADPRVGGVTPKQSIFDRHGNSVRRVADWIEDLRYSLTVPAQSALGQIGCLAGRTIAYRRAAFAQAVEELVNQRVLGVEMSVGDDRVLTNVLLRNGWRTVYQPNARVVTDAPNRWRAFLRQQLRWGRSSQRETLLSLPWLWRRPFTLLCFVSDIAIPLALYGLICLAIANVLHGTGRAAPLLLALVTAYVGMLVSLGIRQIPHFRRYPSDIVLFPIFVLALTFVMAPVRIAALATMFHNGWGTRGVTVRSQTEAHVRV